MGITVANLTNRFGQIADRLQPEATALVRDTAERITDRVVASMEASTPGPSSPGEAPAIDTGNLAGSYQWQMDGDHAADVCTDVDYAPHLEYGTTRMAPRPHLTPAVEAERPAFEAGVRDLIR
jgi:predicted secreted Zn-dependent protease